MTWQPIETAPKEGPAYLVWCRECRNTYGVVYRDEDFLGEPGWFHFGGGGSHRLQEEPTYWQPLPEPPCDSGRHAERENPERSGGVEAVGCQSGGSDSERIAQGEAP